MITIAPRGMESSCESVTLKLKALLIKSALNVLIPTAPNQLLSYVLALIDSTDDR